MTKIILDLCGGTGSWSKPYKDAGYQVINLTLPQYDIREVEFTPDGSLILFPAKDPMENLNVKTSEIYGILATPPCTEFSKAKGNLPRDFTGAMKIVKACLNIIWFARAKGNLKFWALENPEGFLRQFLGKPPFDFYQWEYGGNYSKHTDLWGYFNKPKPIIKAKPDHITAGMGHKSHSAAWANPKAPEEYKHLKLNRVAIRAITPFGFAEAFYKANK